MGIARHFSVLGMLLALIGCGGGGGGGGSSSSTSSDPLVITKATTAHSRGYTGSGVTVAVVDSGVDTDHPDLDANIVSGYDYIGGDADANPVGQGAARSHGTHVAGIIAAENDGIGITGVAYDAKIMPLRIANSSGSLNIGYADNAFDFARTNGAYVINNSWGSSRTVDNVTANGINAWFTAPNRAEDTSVAADFKTAAEAAVNADMVVVFSAGNDYWNSETGTVPVYKDSDNSLIATYPTSSFLAWSLGTNELQIYADYVTENSNVDGQWLAVVAIDSSNVIANFSNGCGDAKAYCLAEPGILINSTMDKDDDLDTDGDGYGIKSGTSMAAPHVSGAIAILKQQWPNLTAAQIVTLLLDNATDLGGSGTDEVYGRGLLNLDGATASSGSLQAGVVTSNGAFLASSINASDLRLAFSNAFRADIGREFIFGALDSYNRQYFFSPATSSGSAKTHYRPGHFKSINHDFGNGMGFYLTQFDGENPTLTASNPNSIARHIMSTGNVWSQNLSTMFADLKFNYSSNEDCQLIGATAEKSKNGMFGKFNFGVGYTNEADTFLCSKISGLDSNDLRTDTLSLYLNYEKRLLPKTTFLANYSYHKSDVDVGRNALNLSIDDLSSDTLDVALEHKLGGAKVRLAYYRPLSAQSGSLSYDTIWGYGENSSYLMENKQIKLRPEKRQQNVVLNISYGAEQEQVGLSLYHVKNINHLSGSDESGARVEYKLRW